MRHNEDKLNEELAELVQWAPDESTMGDSHTKTNLMFQAHMQHLSLPISDYVNDTKSVLDQSLRVLNALVDVAADEACFEAVHAAASVMQCLVQVRQKRGI